MIRWREEKGCYRLEFWNPMEAGILITSGTTLLLACLVLPIFEIRRGETALVACTVTAPILGWGVGMTWLGMVRAREREWVDIAVHGGQARWGGRSVEPIAVFIDVLRFDRVFQGTSVGADARLPDGRTLPAFRRWRGFGVAEVDKAITQMNEYLGAEADPHESKEPPR